MGDNGYFYTKDLVLASYLVYQGIKLSEGYISELKSWSFFDPEECKKFELDLRNGDAVVEVLKYESIRRTLLGMAKDTTRS